MCRIVDTVAGSHEFPDRISIPARILEFTNQFLRADVIRLIGRCRGKVGCLILLHLIHREHLLNIGTDASIKRLGGQRLAADQRRVAFICHLCSLEHIKGRLVAAVHRAYVSLELFRVLRVGMLRVKLQVAVSRHCVIVLESYFLVDYRCADIDNSRPGDLLIFTELFVLHRWYHRWISQHRAATSNNEAC